MESEEENLNAEANERDFVRIPIDWTAPAGTISRYVTHMVVQHTEHEFILSFYELDPPIATGTQEERVSKLKAITTLQPEFIARLVIAPTRMPEFIKALGSNLETYLSNSALIKEEQTEEQ